MRKGSRGPGWVLIVLAIAATAACGPAEEEGAAVGTPGPAGKPVIHVVNYPLQYFAERIAGDRVDVVFLAPAGVDPAYWSPDADTVAAFQSADRILLNGAGYAKWLDRVSLPEATRVDTSAEIVGSLIPLEGQVSHSHGPEGEHEHGDMAITIWLDPLLAAAQSRTIVDALVSLDPAGEDRFRKGGAELEADLSELDRRLQAVAARIPDEPLIFSHPVYQYFVRRYDLNARSVHWEPDAPPDMDELGELLESLAARWVIWEGEPLDASVTTLETAGLSSLTFDPCGNVPGSGDWLEVMRANVARLEAAFP